MISLLYGEGGVQGVGDRFKKLCVLFINERRNGLTNAIDQTFKCELNF